MKRSKHFATMAGSFLAAIIASLCCLGPLLAAILGISGFAVAASFEKWRPVFLVITFALLALAWYLTYRKPKVECKEDAACAAKPLTKWNKAILWLGTILVLLTTAFPSFSSVIFRRNHERATASASANSDVLNLRIPSMDCATCAAGIEATVGKLRGVESADVSFPTKDAVIRYDPAQISSGKIVSSINATGFKAEPAAKEAQ